MRYRLYSTVSAVFTFIFAAVLCVFGFLVMNQKPASGVYETTVAVICDIQNVGEDDHVVTVTYVVDGKEYTGVLNEYSSAYRVGKEVEIRYDPASPADMVSSGKGFSMLLFVFAGAVALFGAFSLYRARHAQPSQNDLEAPSAFAENGVSHGGALSAEANAYYFSTKSGVCHYLLQDEWKRTVLESKRTKFHLFSASEYEIRNALTGRTDHYLIGDAVTTSSVAGISRSYFKWEGENVWSYLKKKGLQIETRFVDVFCPIYTLYYQGNAIAELVSCGTHLFENDPASSRLADIPTNGFYRIHATEEHLDLVFICAFALAHSHSGSSSGSLYRD